MTPRRWRLLSLACLAALVALQFAWHAWWFPPQVLPLGLVLAIAAVPPGLALLACAFDLRFGLLLGGIVGLFYFPHGVMEAWAAPPERLPALAEALLAALQIIAFGAAAQREKADARRAAA
jgi:uncharacterized membrane protein